MLFSQYDSPSSPSNGSKGQVLASVIGVLLGTTSSLFGLDRDGDGMCDIWEARYHATALEPSDDQDGDSCSNLEESIAGTDPFSAESCFEITAVDHSQTSDTIEIATQPGKQYRLRLYTGKSGTWEPVTPWASATSSILEMTHPGERSRGLYQAEVGDADSDSDTLSDWAEMQLQGFLQNEPNSFPGIEDAAAATQMLEIIEGGALTSEVTSRFAYEKEGTAAQVRYSLETPVAFPLTLFPKQRQSLEPGSSSPEPGEWEYRNASGQLLTDHFLVPANSTETTVSVHPVVDDEPEVPEHLVIDLGANGLMAKVSLCDAEPTSENRRLFVSYLSPRSGVESQGSGLSTLVLEGDNTVANVAVSFSSLSSTVNSTQVQTRTGGILQSVPPFNYGGQPWAVAASQTYTSDQAVLDALISGEIELSVFTNEFLQGEISGIYQSASGSPEFRVPAAAEPIPAVSDNALDRDIVRFLTQATFGPTPSSIAALKADIAQRGGDRIAAYEAWIDDQWNEPMAELRLFAKAERQQEINIRSDPSKPYFQEKPTTSLDSFAAGWWARAMNGKAQLRFRTAFALSQIFVVSRASDQVRGRSRGHAGYLDMLSESAEGTYRELIEKVALHPIMGVYLSHLQNRKSEFDDEGNLIVFPDENFGREIMELFSIGLLELHPDGSLKLDEEGLPISTYSQDDVASMARVFTGWSFAVRNEPDDGPTVVENTNFFTKSGSSLFQERWRTPMKVFPRYHDDDAKQVLGLEIPAGQSGEQDLTDALDLLAGHENTAPFLSHRLIQRFVTANPSPGYVYRVSQAYLNSGGNIASTVKAILLDVEARSPDEVITSVTAGKVKEPLLRITGIMRAFGAHSELPISDLVDHGLPADELDSYESGASRYRFTHIFYDFTQLPERSPSVFNWFLPDYAPSGALPENRLVSPEMQLVNESSVIGQINSPYWLTFNVFGQEGTPLLNQEEAPWNYDARADNVRLDRTHISQIYLDVVDENGDGDYTPLDTGTFNNESSIREACEAVLDEVDLLLTAGTLKTRYGDDPEMPRMIILEAMIEIRSSANARELAKDQERSMRDRISSCIWFISSSAEGMTQK